MVIAPELGDLEPEDKGTTYLLLYRMDRGSCLTRGGYLKEGAKTTYGRSQIKPTVGRLDDLPWVGGATYRRFLDEEK